MGLFEKEGKTAEECFALARNQRDPKMAVTHYTKCLELDSNHVYAWYEKACILGVLQQHTACIECLERILRANTQGDTIILSNAWAIKGGAHYALKKYSEAIDCYNKAIEADQTIAPVVWYLKKCAFQRWNRSEDAQTSGAEALKWEASFAAIDGNREGVLDSLFKGVTLNLSRIKIDMMNQALANLFLATIPYLYTENQSDFEVDSGNVRVPIFGALARNRAIEWLILRGFTHDAENIRWH